ncbi:PREDICTED: guanylyl cyclase-activating protein 1 [Theobroma cacao]|uniref:Guanylyl cyclase-activating protein 1 n=1 Tax=Theobroma cacao TaxID=3641 RepID=A0AB32WFV1_THECC|nr:PREDICTED: guanylyl cyclase-activating protein 1 [Theobroma cacao]
MSVAVLDGNTVTGFIEAKEAFGNCVDEYFKMLDSNGDGGISRDELEEGLGRIFTMELESKTEENIDRFYSTIFERFDEDRDGRIDCNEFESLMREIMLAMARGIGDLSIIVALDQDSLLMMAVKHELAGT